MSENESEIIPTAARMRGVADSKNDEILNRDVDMVSKLIERAATEGKFSIEIHVNAFNAIEKTTKLLKNRGFALTETEHEGGTQWNPYTEKYLKISW